MTMLRRFFARHVNAFSFWAVAILVAAVLAFAAYVILPPEPQEPPPRGAPAARP